MEHTDVRNPVWGAIDQSVILCEVKFAGFSDYVPFGAIASDTAQHGREIYAELVAGQWGEIGPYDPPPPPTANEQYAAAIAAGLIVTCAATPELDATYSVSPDSMAAINHESQFIATHDEFAPGESVLPWPDAGGSLHTFPDTLTFMAFARAAQRYVSGCNQTLLALSSGSGSIPFPSNIVAID